MKSFNVCNIHFNVLHDNIVETRNGEGFVPAEKLGDDYNGLKALCQFMYEQGGKNTENKIKKALGIS